MSDITQVLAWVAEAGVQAGLAAAFREDLCAAIHQVLQALAPQCPARYRERDASQEVVLSRIIPAVWATMQTQIPAPTTRAAAGYDEGGPPRRSGDGAAGCTAVRDRQRTQTSASVLYQPHRV